MSTSVLFNNKNNNNNNDFKFDRDVDRDREHYILNIFVICNSLIIMKETAMDRNAWRCLIVGNHPTRASMDKRTLNR
jgi:hypothetical protein